MYCQYVFQLIVFQHTTLYRRALKPCMSIIACRYIIICLYQIVVFDLDIMVISCGKDNHEFEVAVLIEIMSRFSEELDGKKLTFYPAEPMPGENIFDVLEKGLKSSQYTFVFLCDHDGSSEDGWMQFQRNAALMERVEDHNKYIVPVKPHSDTSIPWFLQMYHVLEISSLLKGKKIGEVNAKDLTKDDINVLLMESLVRAISSKDEKLVTKLLYRAN